MRKKCQWMEKLHASSQKNRIFLNVLPYTLHNILQKVCVFEHIQSKFFLWRKKKTANPHLNWNANTVENHTQINFFHKKFAYFKDSTKEKKKNFIFFIKSKILWTIHTYNFLRVKMFHFLFHIYWYFFLFFFYMLKITKCKTEIL